MLSFARHHRLAFQLLRHSPNSKPRRAAMAQGSGDVRLHLNGGDEAAEAHEHLAHAAEDDPESVSGGSAEHDRNMRGQPPPPPTQSAIEYARAQMAQLEPMEGEPQLDPSLPLNKQVPVSAENSRFPYAIVFGPLPCLSWLLPFVGHLGLCDSTGRVHDFAGPFFVQVDSFMVTPQRFVQLAPEQLEMAPAAHMHNPFDDGKRASQWLRPAQRRWIWDHALAEGDAEFERRSHNILCMNCHHHVSYCFERMGLRISAWKALWLVMTRGQFVSTAEAVKFFLPAAIVWTLIAVIIVYA